MCGPLCKCDPQQYWFWLYNAPVIPIGKKRGKAQLNHLSGLTKKASVGAENRNQITWGFIAGNVSLPSPTESLFSPGAGRWECGQYAAMFPFPEGNQALQAHFTEAARPLGLPRAFAALTGRCKIQQSDLCRGWQSPGAAHYLKTGSHNMLVWTSETNLWNGPWWGLDWPELPSESVPIPPLHPVCVYWRRNEASFKFCTCICTVTFLAVTSWLYLKLVIKCNSG